MPIQITPELIHALLGGRFVVQTAIGQGGQGAVFRARRTARPDGRAAADDCALKIHFDPQQDERVVREIGVMERLRHPCLANLIEHGVLQTGADQVRYIAWEFIDGIPLATRITAGPLPARTVAVVGRDVATALAHVWAEGVVHRDVKPANIMLRTGDEAAVLIDLGAARHLTQATLTAVGWTCGTSGYMSPEQARGEQQLTCFSDVFALGLALIEALTGRHPTGHRQDLLQSSAVVPSQLLPAAPVGLVRLLDQMVKPRPAFRPRPEALADAFGRLVPQL